MLIMEQENNRGAHTLACPHWWSPDVAGDGPGLQGLGVPRPQGSVSGVTLWPSLPGLPG